MDATEGQRKVVVEGVGPERRWVVRQEQHGQSHALGSFPTEVAALRSRAMRKGSQRWAPSGKHVVGAALVAAALALLVVQRRAGRPA